MMLKRLTVSEISKLWPEEFIDYYIVIRSVDKASCNGNKVQRCTVKDTLIDLDNLGIIRYKDYEPNINLILEVCQKYQENSEHKNLCDEIIDILHGCMIKLFK